LKEQIQAGLAGRAERRDKSQPECLPASRLISSVKAQESFTDFTVLLRLGEKLTGVFK
jgi:hypothetical protein